MLTKLKSFVKSITATPEVEISKKDLHSDMHVLIQRHKELIARIKENHNLIQSMKHSDGMGRQKAYVWQKIQKDRETATEVASNIVDIKVRIYGNKATNIVERV